MKRVLISIVFLSGLVGCSKQATSPQPEANAAQSAPSVLPNASAPIVAPTSAIPTPGASVGPPPLVPSNPKDGGKQAKVDQKPLPSVIGDRLYRALTLEEINKLPPETRDMILRAQGRLPASPAPKKK
jgi:hypothetical protein